MNKLLLLFFLFGTFLTFGQTNWKLVKEEASLKIEVKSTLCNVNNREQFLVLIRLTNTSNEKRTFYWKVNRWRNGECTNCTNNSGEQFVSITLNPGESIEGDCSSKFNKATYIFDHYVNWVQGMTKQTLTNYEFVNISSQVSL